MEDKPTLLQVRRDAGLTSKQVAEAAGIPLRTEYVMEIGGYAQRQDAIAVLDALSKLTGKRYTLQDVSINLKPVDLKPPVIGVKHG